MSWLTRSEDPATELGGALRAVRRAVRGHRGLRGAAERQAQQGHLRRGGGHLQGVRRVSRAGGGGAESACMSSVYTKQGIDCVDCTALNP